MSAICGYWMLRGDRSAPEAVSRMQSAQLRLGPHGKASCEIGQITLGYQRLEITAEDGFESQPLRLKGSGHPTILVADARIFNRDQLAVQLGYSVDEAALMPDSGFVASAWERWGQECVDHLVGAFAFAVWDEQTQQLYLATDHAGERPLYFCRTSNAFAFATSARALLTCPGISSEVDRETLARDLIGLPPEHTKTRYRDIRQLGPGHCMIVKRNDVDPTPRRHWQYDRLPETRFKRDEDYVEGFLAIFDEAVRCRLGTKGGIGSELSGGLDSGSVTATAARLLAPSGKTLTAYTSVPRREFSGLTLPDCIADEGPLAAEVANLYPNISHERVDSSGSDVMREMERSFPLLERALGAPINQVWINLIFDQAAAAGINVLLNGRQGNATMSYSGADAIGHSFRTGHWVRAMRQAYLMRRDGMSSGREALSQTVFAHLPWWLRVRVDPFVRSYSLEEVAIRPERDRELQLFDEIGREITISGTRLPPIMQTIFHAKGTADFNSMSLAGWGIELRDPTADKRVFEFCASIPMEQYVTGKGGRALIRRAMRGRMPDSALDRRTRGMQGADWYEGLTPIHTRMAGEITRLQENATSSWLLDLDRIQRAVEHWPATPEEAARQAYLYSMIVPDAVALGYFIRRSEEARPAAEAC